MRRFCPDCTRKHLAQAIVLMIEADMGYPEHGWLAVGHMAEAEAEFLEKNAGIANDIRNARLSYMDFLNGDETSEKPYLLDIIENITELIRNEIDAEGETQPIQEGDIHPGPSGEVQG